MDQGWTTVRHKPRGQWRARERRFDTVVGGGCRHRLLVVAPGLAETIDETRQEELRQDDCCPGCPEVAVKRVVAVAILAVLSKRISLRRSMDHARTKVGKGVVMAMIDVALENFGLRP